MLRAIAVIAVLALLVHVPSAFSNPTVTTYPPQPTVTLTVPVKIIQDQELWINNHRTAAIRDTVNLINWWYSDFKVPREEQSLIAHAVVKACQQYGMTNDLLVRLIAAESGFRSDARSSHGAYGYTQVVPSTWENLLPYDIFDPQDNILAGAHVLKHYKDRCGDWACALKSYNVGITAFNNGRRREAAERYIQKFLGVPLL